MSTAFITVVTGTLVYVLGQFINNFFIGPIKDYYGVIAEIPAKLQFHANYITNGPMKPKKSQEVRDDIRKLAVDLEVAYLKIPFIRQLAFFRMFRLVPKNRLEDAVGSLYLLSNEPGNIHTHENLRALEKVYSSLGIKKLRVSSI